MELESHKKSNTFRFAFISLIVGVIAFFFVGCGSGKNGRSETKGVSTSDFKIPIYGYAQNVKPFVLEGGLVRGVSYTVKLPYPAPDVLNYYDEAMNEIGYQPFVEEHSKYTDRTWQTFVDGTMKGRPYVTQLNANWVDQKHENRAVLNLRYYWYPDHTSAKIVLGENDDLNVSIQIMPFLRAPEGFELKPK